MYSIENKDPPRKLMHTKLNCCSLNINSVVIYAVLFTLVKDVISFAFCSTVSYS